MIRELERDRRPVAFVMTIPGLAETELRRYAWADHDGCCGYFPTLAGCAGIVSELPVGVAFAGWLPAVISQARCTASAS